MCLVPALVVASGGIGLAMRQAPLRRLGEDAGAHGGDGLGGVAEPPPP